MLIGLSFITRVNKGRPELTHPVLIQNGTLLIYISFYTKCIKNDVLVKSNFWDLPYAIHTFVCEKYVYEVVPY